MWTSNRWYPERSKSRGFSSDGRASALQAEGQGFESPKLHRRSEAGSDLGNPAFFMPVQQQSTAARRLVVICRVGPVVLVPVGVGRVGLAGLSLWRGRLGLVGLVEPAA